MAFEIIQLAIGLRVLNIIILIFLFQYYWRAFRRIKSGYTSGLLFFSIMLLIQNLSAIHFRLLSGVDYGDEISFHNTILNFLQLFGLLALAVVTRKHIMRT